MIIYFIGLRADMGCLWSIQSFKGIFALFNISPSPCYTAMVFLVLSSYLV